MPPTTQTTPRLSQHPPGFAKNALLSMVQSRGLRRITGAALFGAAWLAFAGPAGAQDISATEVQTNLDNVFVLLAAVLVIFMQAGFALVEAGLTRAKNVSNIFAKIGVSSRAAATAFAFEHGLTEPGPGVS